MDLDLIIGHAEDPKILDLLSAFMTTYKYIGFVLSTVIISIRSPLFQS